MKGASILSFAKAREEIQLWPAAAFAYYYTENDTIIILCLFLISVWTGAITYKMHEGIREVLEEEKNISAVRRRVSRNHTKGNAVKWRLWINIWDEFSPDSKRAKTTVIIGMVLNLGIGIYMFLWLAWRLLSSVSPPLAVISLFSLPLLMLAMTSASIIWSY